MSVTAENCICLTKSAFELFPFGADGFARAVVLSIVAFNIHRIDLHLRKRARRRCLAA